MMPSLQRRHGAGYAEQLVQGDHRQVFAAHLNNRRLTPEMLLIMPGSACSDSIT